MVQEEIDGYILKNKFKAVIFDLDGLMIDSEPFHCLAYDRILQEYGFGLTPEENAAHYVGIGDLPIAQDLIKKYQLPISEQELIERKCQEYIKLLTKVVKPLPGLTELVKYLWKKGYQLAIASGSSLQIVRLAAEKLGLAEFFTIYQSAENLKQGKPAPDIFLQTAKRLNCLPAECLVLEDAPSGLKAAISAGMVCVIIPSRETKNSDFSGAKLVLSSLNDVIELL